MSNYVYIATTIDGFIAKVDGSMDWLTSFPVPEDTDFGYQELMMKIDAIVMGRHTYEFVAQTEYVNLHSIFKVLGRS